VTVNPGGGSGWDEAPLDIQIPDDARELDRDVLAYHRELRAQRRRNRLRRLTGPFSGPGTVMPLLASILAVCLVAGAMLSVATFSPATAPADNKTRPPSATGAASPAPPRSHAPASPTGASQTGTSQTGTSLTSTNPRLTSTAARPTGTGTSPASASATTASHPASHPAGAAARARPSGSGSARSTVLSPVLP
jgi:hypothetical protein